MFIESEKIYNKSQPFSPKSATFKTLGNERGAIGGLTQKKTINSLIERFGTSEKVEKLGFIVPEGKIINVNRHDAVGNIPKFMKDTGSIRVRTNRRNELFIEIIGKPTKQQTSKLKQLSGKYSQYVIEATNDSGVKIIDTDVGNFGNAYLQLINQL